MALDDAIVGKWNFQPIYRFIVLSYLKLDKKQNQIMYVVDDPIMAYSLYLEGIASDKGTPNESLYDWTICDSFNKDALEFCKKMAENPIVDLTMPEEAEI
jgi:hypothetical protein